MGRRNRPPAPPVVRSHQASLYPDIDQQITARLTESEAWRYQREHSRQALQHRLRAAQLAGHDITALIDQITAAPMDGARSISGVLHGRLQRGELPDPGNEVTWSQRTPATASEVAHELAAGLDGRIRELGERMIAQPQPWLLKHLGMLATESAARRPGCTHAVRILGRSRADQPFHRHGPLVGRCRQRH